jgi:hypothetical protein
MTDQAKQLNKLATIATDLELSAELRIKAIESVANIGSHEALVVLLDLAANEKLIKEERSLAIKHAQEIIKSGH